MQVGWNELEMFVLCCHELLQDLGALVVQIVHFRCKPAFREYVVDCSVTFEELRATAIFHGFVMNCVGVVVVGYHDVFETAAWCDGESAGLICVKFSQ